MSGQAATLQSAQNQHWQSAQAPYTPQPILVQLSDDTIQRVVTAILDGMQERWGRRTDDA
jgi:hypothetical protein